MTSATTQQLIATDDSVAQANLGNCLPTDLGPTSHNVDRIPNNNVTTVLNYFKGCDPRRLESEPGPGLTYASETKMHARTIEPQRTVVYDIRGSEAQYTLDVHGFQIVKQTSKEKGFLDDEQIKRVYYPEIEHLLTTVTRAPKVLIFNHTIRRGLIDPSIASKSLSRARAPFHQVHVDQSYTAGPKRVYQHLPDEASTLLKGRYQIINVWRPIKTILKDPLCVAEAGSVQDSDIIPIKFVYLDSKEGGDSHSARATPVQKPDRDGEVFFVGANPEHKWRYIHKQTPDEVLLIMCFDSKTDGRARRAPHTAFIDDKHEDAPERESIELRVLLFHPEDTE